MAEFKTKLFPKPLANTPKSPNQLIFGFFDEGDESSDGSSSCGSSNIDFDPRVEIFDVAEKEEDEDNYASNAEAAKAYWVSQEELLLATLRRTSSFESKIRKATKDAVKELKLSSVGGEVNYCACRKAVAVAGGCRKCKQEQICRRLQEGGFSCYVCKSKWKSSPGIPAGEHTYMEVVEASTSKKGEVKVIIELNFQAEFVVAKASEEYSRLVTRLPEIFVGKQERMKTLVKILCCSLKKCLKGKKMHMAPWRKHKYMQAKWVGKPAVAEKSQETEVLAYGKNDHFERLIQRRPKASMLTFEFLDSLPAGLNLVPMIQVL